MSLGDARETAQVFGAEDAPPQSADRLWEQAHPAELTFLIASGTSLISSGTDPAGPGGIGPLASRIGHAGDQPSRNTGEIGRTTVRSSQAPGGNGQSRNGQLPNENGPSPTEHGQRQNFQVVSADIRVVWRIGLTDADALHAHYSVTDPAAILRGTAGRAVAVWFAGETLNTVLGEAREDQANKLRAAIQHDLDNAGAGIELMSLVIEAIHPPAGAADAYHAVQAAEIIANSQIAAEQGNAQATLAKASQYAVDIIGNAKARAGDTVAEARAQATRFSADIIAGHAGGPSFLLNRYLSNVGSALSAVPLTIVDHRIPAPDAPMLDLRPPTMPSASVPGAE
jgi:hypothetical protein